MLYGVFSDVHGNYEALKVVLQKLKEAGAQSYICCGDLVGYGPQPNECVETVASLPNLYCVTGNHDMAVLGFLPLNWFNSYAGAAIEFTKQMLSPRSVMFLQKCPSIVAHDDFTLVHGSPNVPAEEYLLTGEQFLENADKWSTQVCFIGHSHTALYISRQGVRFPMVNYISNGERIFFEEDKRYMVNPGSTGQPRDRNPRAACGLYDSEAHTFELYRLDYPMQVTQEQMRKLNLPDLLIERIANGW